MNVVLPSVLVGALSCTDVSTGPITDASGSVTFSHDLGQFAASGPYSSKADNDTKRGTTWAIGFLNNADHTTVVEAHIARTDGLSDQLLLVVDRQNTGTTTISSSCTTTVVHRCPSVEVLFGTTGNFFNDPNVTRCALLNGSATITSVTADKVVGSFSGDGTCAPSGTAGTDGYVWSIQSGTFDVGLVSQP